MVELRKTASRTSRAQAPDIVPTRRTPTTNTDADSMAVKQCYIPDCDYTTSEGLTIDQQVTDLRAHSEIAHRRPSAPNTVPPREATAKPRELPRLTVEEDITESDWKHFLVKWA